MMLIALILLLLVWRYALWFPRRLPEVNRTPPYLLGHRGTRGEGLPPENTLAAFEHALQAGLDGLECDVQRSRDGVLVLFHDFETNGRSVSAQSLAELKAQHPQLCTLDELLALAARYPGTLINLELKSRTLCSDGLERDVVRAVRAAGLAGRTVISSFNPLSLLRVRLLAPELRVGLLYAPELPWYLREGLAAGWLHVDALHPHESQVTPELLAQARSQGLMVNTWTVNDPLRISSLAQQQTDAIIGDNPALLLAIRRRNDSGGRGDEG